MVAIRTQQPDVALRGGVGHHVEIHGRSHKHRSLGRQIGGDEHIVGHSAGHLGYGGGRGGRYHHGVGPEAYVDMAVPLPCIGCEKLAYDRTTAQSRQRDRSYELLSGRGDYHLHLRPCLYKQAEQADRLVGCDTAGDAEYYVLAFQHQLPSVFIRSLTAVKASLVFCEKSPCIIQL